MHGSVGSRVFSVGARCQLPRLSASGAASACAAAGVCAQVCGRAGRDAPGAALLSPWPSMQSTPLLCAVAASTICSQHRPNVQKNSLGARQHIAPSYACMGPPVTNLQPWLAVGVRHELSCQVMQWPPGLAVFDGARCRRSLTQGVRWGRRHVPETLPCLGKTGMGSCSRMQQGSMGRRRLQGCRLQTSWLRRLPSSRSRGWC